MQLLSSAAKRPGNAPDRVQRRCGRHRNRRRRALASAGAALTLLVVTALPDAGAAPQLNLAVELGPELDTNANRVVDQGVVAATIDSQGNPVDGDALRPEAAPLLRGSIEGTLRLIGTRRRLEVGYSAGAKLFLNQAGRAADEAVQRATLRGDIALGSLALSLAGSYYDIFQRGSSDPLIALTERDFRTGTSALRLAYRHPRSGMGIGLESGYQGFTFKPNGDFSFNGMFGHAELGWHGAASEGAHRVDWSAELSYTLLTRWFVGSRLVCADTAGLDCGSDPSNTRRRDMDHVGRVRLGYLGAASAAVWYMLDVNRSNSYAQTYLRHIVGLEFTTPLVWEIYLTTVGVLQLSSFAQRLAYTPPAQLYNVLLDEENRSRVTTYVARTFAEHWSIGLRHAIYVNESGGAAADRNQPRFLRQTAMLVLRFEYDFNR